MLIALRKEKAGAFADRRFRDRRRAWLRRFWWALPLVAIIEIGTVVGLSLLFPSTDTRAFLGGGVGAALATIIIVADSPPHHIERWRQGAAGERATAKALRALERRGWTVLHDLDLGRGNADHVAVGPAGVFLLETKNLNGVASVSRGVLSIRWREDPLDGYDNHRLAPRLRAASAQLAELLQRRGSGPVWVQPVVVLWCPFDQGPTESGRVAWLHGSALTATLLHRPAQLSPERLRCIADALRALEAATPPGRPDASAMHSC